MKRFFKEFMKKVIVLLLVIAQLLPIYNIPAACAADKKDSKIRFNDFYGEVKIRPDSEEDDSYEFVDLDTIIYEGDRIKTEEDSGAILGLEDMSTYVIKPDSTLIIHTDEGNVSKIEMLAGSMWGNIKKMAEGKSLEIEMSQCVCGINGTTIYAQTSETRQKKLDLNEIKKDADQIKNQVDEIKKDFDKAKNGEKEQQQQAKLAKQKKVKNELSEKIENSSAPIIVPTKTTGNNSEAVLSNHQNTGLVVEKDKIDPEFGNNNENKSQTSGIQVQLVKPNEKNTNIETDNNNNNNNNNNNKELENIIKGIDYRRLNNGHDGLVGANKISEEEIKQKEQLEKIELKVLMSSPRPEVQTEQADIQKQQVNQLPRVKTNDQIQEELRQALKERLQEAQQKKQAQQNNEDQQIDIVANVKNEPQQIDVVSNVKNEPQQIDVVSNVKNEPQIKDVIVPVDNNPKPNIAAKVDSIAAKLNNEAQQKNNPAKTTAPGVAPGKPQASDAAGVVNNRATKVEDAANGVKNNAQKVQQMDGKVHDDRPKVKDASNGLNKLQLLEGKIRPQSKAQMSNRTDIVKVLKGIASIRNKVTQEIFKVPSGNQATITGNVVIVEPIVNIENDQKELNQQLDRSNDKQSTKQLIDKLNGQTGQINDSKKPLDNMLDTIKKLLDGNATSDRIKQASSAYTKAVEEGKRFVSIFVEVNSTINVLSKRISADSVMVVSSDESEAAADAIKKANEAMNSFSQSLEALVGYADKIEEKTGANPLDSLTSQAEKANEIKETIVSSNGEIDEVTKGITDESSYSDFKNAITRCEALLRDLQNLNERLTVSEVGTEALAALKKQFLGVYLKVEKAIKDYSSVPEIKTATLKQMNDFENDVPSFSSDIRKYLKEYKSINSSSTDAKKRYVESATRTLASYDRMRRVYTKANRMYTQMEKEFKQSKFKTAEYNEVKESWEKIEQAMTEIDSEASELSSCVEDLKSQLESLLGQ